ncbi:MAG: hypothetical protein NTX86_05495 [Candidatus Dependentiae bacterium]|nr:hypothetical protein [Candidatus Dependentiae bacterium]
MKNYILLTALVAVSMTTVSKAESLADKATRTAQSAKAMAVDAAQKTKVMAANAVDSVKNAVANNPKASAAIAVGVGAAVAGGVYAYNQYYNKPSVLYTAQEAISKAKAVAAESLQKLKTAITYHPYAAAGIALGATAVIGGLGYVGYNKYQEVKAQRLFEEAMYNTNDDLL